MKTSYKTSIGVTSYLTTFAIAALVLIGILIGGLGDFVSFVYFDRIGLFSFLLGTIVSSALFFKSFGRTGNIYFFYSLNFLCISCRFLRYCNS